jgi:hypothetical protein
VAPCLVAPPRCPDCPGAPAGVRIVHGFPSAELFEAAERGEIVLGGCEVFPGPQPRWACPVCRDYLGWGGPARDVGPAAPGLFRIATWNLRGRPHPGYGKGEEVARWQEKVSADVWLLTEVHSDWGWSSGNWAVSPPRSGEAPDTRRWAGIQTQLPMTQLLDDSTDRPAAEESLCLARVHLPESVPVRSVLIACSMLPFRGAGKWWPGLPERYLNDQQEFVLEHHLHRIAEARDGDEPILWGGDFNQELVDLQPERKAAGYHLAGTVAGTDRLRAAFERLGLRPLTEGSEHLNPEAPTIDHLAVSVPLARGKAEVYRPHYEDGTLLSDHAAYVADIAL